MSRYPGAVGFEIDSLNDLTQELLGQWPNSIRLSIAVSGPVLVVGGHRSSQADFDHVLAALKPMSLAKVRSDPGPSWVKEFFPGVFSCSYHARDADLAIRIARAWVEQEGQETWVWMQDDISRRVAVEDVPFAVRGAMESERGAWLATGTPGSVGSQLALSPLGASAMGWGGMSVSPTDLVDGADSHLLAATRRVLQDIVYMFVAFDSDWMTVERAPLLEPKLGGALLIEPAFLWRRPDRLVADAFGVQLLSQGHLDQLTTPPSSVEMVGDRAIVRCGELSAWNSAATIGPARDSGRLELAGLVRSESEAKDYLRGLLDE